MTEFMASGLREYTFDFTQVSSFVRFFHEMQRDYAPAAGLSQDMDGTNTPSTYPDGPPLSMLGLTNFADNYGMNDNYSILA